MTGKRAARRRLARAIQPIAAPTAPAQVPARPAMKVTDEARAWARSSSRPMDAKAIFEPYKPAPGVLPAGQTIAMDAVSSGYSQTYDMSLFGAWEEGQQFLGYPALSILAQRAEYRVIANTFAEEMTRKWIEIYSDDEGKEDAISAIEDELDRLDARDTFRNAVEHDGLFGRGQIYLDYGDRTGSPEGQNEVKTDLGDGRDETTRAKVVNRRLKALKTIEPVWTYPAGYNTTNPLADGWYEPTSWYVMGKEVHASRLLTIIGREVPDILKPAYAFGGLSLTQMCKPYVDSWIETDRGVTDIVTSFSVWVVKTNMAAVLNGGGGEDLAKRLDMLAGMRSNRKVFAIDKEMEDFANVAASLAGLDRLVGQKQEHLCLPAKMPLVKMTGISPSGLNASSEGELQSWDDNVLSAQEAVLRPALTKLLNLVQLGLTGEIDDAIKFRFAPLREISQDDQAELSSKITAAVVAAFDGGLIDKATAMEELKKSSNITGIFASIPQEAIDEERLNPTPAPGEGGEPPAPEGKPGEAHTGATPDQWAAALGGNAEGEDGGASAEQWAVALAADDGDP